ncbi:MAG: RNase adapter RapZ [Deltaproteobacteria bacterium]|nr:RNase adapter RapZ [Deltaproteobacteria bacterium]
MSQASAIVVVTGMSGAGRSTALHVLEDLGYYCIDNLPPPLVSHAVKLCTEDAQKPLVGIGMDVRTRAFLDSVDDEVERLRNVGQPTQLVFLDAEDPVLIRRYSESRRPHPLSSEHPGEDLPTLIARERERLVPLRAMADRVVDTSRLNAHEFKQHLVHLFAGDGAPRMTTRVLSFGFKHGSPAEADVQIDVRHIPNPHFVPELKPRSGRDPAVASYVLDRPETQELLSALVNLLQPLLPRYAREGKVVLTVAIGCTGGRHRSVAITEELARRLSAEAPGPIVVAHRDIERGG